MVVIVALIVRSRVQRVPFGNVASAVKRRMPVRRKRATVLKFDSRKLDDELENLLKKKR